jgi:hypothetical protein
MCGRNHWRDLSHIYSLEYEELEQLEKEKEERRKAEELEK